MTLVKSQRTGGNQHWACVVEGEGQVDTAAFGPAVLVADPNNPHDLMKHLDLLQGAAKGGQASVFSG